MRPLGCAPRLRACFAPVEALLLALLASLQRSLLDALQKSSLRSRAAALAGLALRALPAAATPVAVLLLQPHSSMGYKAASVTVTLAAVVGVLIAWLVPWIFFAWPLAACFAGLVVTSSHLQIIGLQQSRESRQYASWAPKLRGPQSAGLETMSVVLPCAFEREFAVRTVEAVLNHTRHSRLLEIIVVDDGSIPMLIHGFPQSLLAAKAPGEPVVRILRHETTRGLIAAKKTGGEAARGDVIVFFDCHVLPRDGWEDAFLRQMRRAGDHRTVVVPTITWLDPDKWVEDASKPSSSACIMFWNADFTWLDAPGRDVPIMSGGLLAISRRWWEETGGYDDRMVAWGGENIDQSLRTWLCGGRIEVAEGAYVAHMWREASNPKTRLHYPMATRDVMRNKARASAAWLGAFKAKTFAFAEYAEFESGANDIGDMRGFDRVKEKLQCAPFSHYISRFSYVYLDAGLIPDEVFQLQEATTGRCLERWPSKNAVDRVVLGTCTGDGTASGPAAETQWWHGANRHREKPGMPCCSGLANWNYYHCLQAAKPDSLIETGSCYITGTGRTQQFFLDALADGGASLRWQDRDVQALCAVPRVSADLKPAGPLELRACARKRGQVFRKTNVTAAAAFLFRIGDPGTSCLAFENAQLLIGACDEEKQRWRLLPQSGQLQHVKSEMCLDANDDRAPMLHPCHRPVVNRLQRFDFEAEFGWVRLKSSSGDNGRKRHFERCVDSEPEALLEVALEPCPEALARGVRWRRRAGRTPLETRLWRAQAAELEGARLLGGEAQPPYARS